MGAQTVGIREFRDKLASYLLEADGPLAITRHGDTIGYYLPVRRRPSAVQLDEFRKAGLRMQKMMAEAGVTEEEMVEEFRRLRKHESRKK
jgi:hypothetical protein